MFFLPRPSLLIPALMLLAFFAPLSAGEADDAESAALALVNDQEKQGFTFRAETWVAPLSKDFGKAVRMQMFKGNEYCVAVAVPRKSGIHVKGEVLDLDGKPVGEIQPVLEGWGFLLFFKPKKTGVYVATVRMEESGKLKDTHCALITGYR
ncbi:MAG TPA: hypothetical protein PK490_19155 [Prosthecobacter sp.]|nr:hypothetical protein [Prosthecobacter sp.]HRK16409.1 hypothetical protein [Prosthecobacter sp.]